MIYYKCVFPYFRSYGQFGKLTYEININSLSSFKLSGSYCYLNQMLKNKGMPVDNISMNAFKKKMKGKGDNARQNTDSKSKGIIYNFIFVRSIFF